MKHPTVLFTELLIGMNPSDNAFARPEVLPAVPAGRPAGRIGEGAALRHDRAEVLACLRSSPKSAVLYAKVKKLQQGRREQDAAG